MLKYVTVLFPITVVFTANFSLFQSLLFWTFFVKMALDVRGYISLALLVIYMPILLTSVFLVWRHGIQKQTGFIFLFVLSLVRIIGSVTHIVAEQSSNPSTGLIECYSILENVGLSPLMMATLGFLTTVGRGVFEDPMQARAGMQFFTAFASTSMIITVIGGVDLASATSQSDVNKATTFRHVGCTLFLALFIMIFLLHLCFWVEVKKVMPQRRKMLIGISAALPFLLVRVVYSMLSGYSPISIPSTTPVQNSLSKFSSTNGSWQWYLVMSVAAELITVITYLILGVALPVSQEYDEAEPYEHDLEEATPMKSSRSGGRGGRPFGLIGLIASLL
ncbi:hypothetical protein EUX98_g6707 [Antrodiella citrinella]|uniref:DUF7702 domain-containing protein n=1 Tax=Antrodiella citrinella TaxID=2447956 RepID=A0A4S4MNC1_9APHY|nr:hypothetical protein EUX98_g6707 [Antrodiella citrinella]